MSTGDEASATTVDVVCAGILVADTFVPAIPALPAAGDLVQTGDFLLDAGGCAANTAITLASLGVRVGIAASVGDDGNGRWLRETLGSRGVATDHVATTREHGTSSTVIVTVEGDDRRYLHAIGANAALGADAIDRARIGARILVVGGYLVLPGLTSAGLCDVLEAARRDGTMTVLDVVVPEGSMGAIPAVRGVLQHVDLFLPNRDEAAALVGTHDPIEQARVLLEWGCRAVAITCGGDGVVYADADRVLQVRPYPVEVVDGSGAGDAFTAGLVAGMLDGRPIEDSLRFAAAVGASACRGLGCTTTLFTRDEALAAARDVHVDELAAR